MFAGARCYIGTLFPVSDGEAQAIAGSLMCRYFGRPLPQAIWAAQNATYGPDDDRRPYVMTGVYPQRLRTTKEDAPRRLFGLLLNEFERLDRRLQHLPEADEHLRRALTRQRNYYQNEAGRIAAAYAPRNPA